MVAFVRAPRRKRILTASLCVLNAFFAEHGLHASWTFIVLQQQQNLGRRFGTSKMHLGPPVAWAAVRSRAVVLLLLTYCWLLLPLWESVIVLCFVVRYFMSILVLQSSWWGRESWLLCLICLPGVSWWLSGSSSRCHGVVFGLLLWYFLIILTYYFWDQISIFFGHKFSLKNARNKLPS